MWSNERLPAVSRLEALREVDERCKIHDVVMEGSGLALRKRGHPPINELKGKSKGPMSADT
jgi:hypothetical protein